MLMILPRIVYKSKNPILKLKVPNSGKSWGWVRWRTKRKNKQTREASPGKEGGGGCVQAEVAMWQASEKVGESSRSGGAPQGRIGHVQSPRTDGRSQGKCEKRVDSGKNNSSSSHNKPTHWMGISLPILRSPDITHQREPPCFWMSKSQRNPIGMGFERSCCQRDALRNIHISV